MAKSNTIKLGKKPDSGIVKSVPEKPSNKMYYPTVHLSGMDGIDNLPSGTFNFSGVGKVVHRAVSERNGKRDCSCEIEIHEITPDSASSEEGGLDKELDRIAAKKKGVSAKQQEADEGDE